MFNTMNLSPESLNESTEPGKAIYPEGTVFVSEEGVTYRARRASENFRGEIEQEFSTLEDGGSGRVSELPKGVKLIWAPAEAWKF